MYFKSKIKHANVNIDIIVSAKKNIVEILTDVFVKIENI